MFWFKRRETPEEAFERGRREQIERVIAALKHLRAAQELNMGYENDQSAGRAGKPK